MVPRSRFSYGTMVINSSRPQGLFSNIQSSQWRHPLRKLGAKGSCGPGCSSSELHFSWILFKYSLQWVSDTPSLSDTLSLKISLFLRKVLGQLKYLTRVTLAILYNNIPDYRIQFPCLRGVNVRESQFIRHNRKVSHYVTRLYWSHKKKQLYHNSIMVGRSKSKT